MFGKIDPFLEIKQGENIFQTEVVEEGGAKVSWKKECVLEIKNKEDIILCAKDKDKTGSNEIGTGRCSLDQIKRHTGACVIPVTCKDNSGTIVFDYTVIPINPPA